VAVTALATALDRAGRRFVYVDFTGGFFRTAPVARLQAIAT